MDADQIEKTIGKVNGSMSIEGMPLTSQDKDRLRDCLNGKISFNDAIAQLINKHKVKTVGK